MKKILLKGTIVSLLILVIILSKVFISAHKEYKKAEEAQAKQNYLSAIVHYERSLRWYFPFNPYTKKSIQQLWETGGNLEREGDKKGAAIAFRSLRSALYSMRSFYTPYKPWIKKCNSKITSLIVSNKEIKNKIVKDLLKDDAPNLFWSAVTVVSFIGWVLSGFGFILVGFANDNRLNYRKVIPYGISFFLLYGGWIVGMMMA